LSSVTNNETIYNRNGTDVGKTIASAIITEALEADYWKPIQAGRFRKFSCIKSNYFCLMKKTVIHPIAMLEYACESTFCCRT
jgi:hypothetical protein